VSSGTKFKPLIFQAAVMQPELLQDQMSQKECENMTGLW